MTEEKHYITESKSDLNEKLYEINDNTAGDIDLNSNKESNDALEQDESIDETSNGYEKSDGGTSHDEVLQNDQEVEFSSKKESFETMRKEFLCLFRQKLKNFNDKFDEAIQKNFERLNCSKVKTIYIKVFLIILLFFLLLIFLVNSSHYYKLNGEDTPKYVVDQFITQLRVNVEHVGNGAENQFPKGKRVQVYGPIVRIKSKVVYMKAEDCMLEITMSNKKEIPYVILGKQYKIEATISDVSGLDEEIYLKKGIFLDPIPSSVR